MDASRIIAERIGSLIDGKGKPQREQAAEIGISPQALSDYRNGNREPGLYAATRLADYFGVSLDYLAGKEECKTPDNEQIHKITGLSEYAIMTLKEHWREGRAKYEPSIIDIINTCLDTDSGFRLIELLVEYSFLDFNRAFNGDCYKVIHDKEGMRWVEFATRGAPDARTAIKVSRMGDALLLNFPKLLKDFRDTVQASYFEPFIDEEEVFDNVDPEDSK